MLFVGRCEVVERSMTPPDLTVVPDVEQELDRLYAAPLTEFTGARNELVKRLRKAGDKTRAEHVAALRKPSVTAWAINQTTRREPGQVEAVVQAGRELFEAQRATLGGETAGRFETAQTQHRDAGPAGPPSLRGSRPGRVLARTRRPLLSVVSDGAKVGPSLVLPYPLRPQGGGARRERRAGSRR